MPDRDCRLGEYALKIEDLYIVPLSSDQVTGDLITSLSFIIDSPVSQVQQDTSIGRGIVWWKSSFCYSTALDVDRCCLKRRYCTDKGIFLIADLQTQVVERVVGISNGTHMSELERTFRLSSLTHLVGAWNRYCWLEFEYFIGTIKDQSQIWKGKKLITQAFYRSPQFSILTRAVKCMCWYNGDRTGSDDLPRVFWGETSSNVVF